MLICARDCFDSSAAVYYKQGEAYERGDIGNSALLKHFVDQETFNRDQKAAFERELKSVSVVKDLKADLTRESKARRKIQEIDE
jgi:hypothetical protein